MRSGETGAWTARRPRERLGTPSKDLPFTVWATPQLLDLARVGTVWYGPLTGSVLIHPRTGVTPPPAKRPSAAANVSAASRSRPPIMCA